MVTVRSGSWSAAAAAVENREHSVAACPQGRVGIDRPAGPATGYEEPAL